MSYFSNKLNIFNKHGFVEFENVIETRHLSKIKQKYKKIFNGYYSTGVVPDKIKWVKGRDSDKSPRSLCNVWKSDYDIARIVLLKKLGEIAAKLSGWNSCKVNQDSLIWVPPKCGTISFHQDNPYQDWHTPGGVITAWIPLDITRKDGATLEYLVGSHKTKISKRLKKFYSNKNYRFISNKLLKDKNSYKRHFVEIKPGSVIFHHGNTWHGSGYNKTKTDRVTISIHFMNGNSKFHKSIKSPYFNHYKIFNKTDMDDTFFPLVWSKSKKNLNFVNKYLKKIY